MDISDINKVASRKRMSADAEKLREKVAQETAKVIKLKVAQDTAYWDLKEKLQQVEGNHEKLQQNMVEVQMQYEAISGQYQEELRLRPDTLNKLSSTREICDVLQDYSERLKGTLTRCKEDQVALYDAYQRSGQVVRDLKTKQVEENEKNRSHVQGLEEKVKMITDHQNQLTQFFTAAKQQADSEIADLRSQLTSANSHKHEFLNVQSELNNKLSQYRNEIEKKEEMNANLHADMKNLVQEFNSQASKARDVLGKQDEKIKELSDENASLKTALSNQEEFTKTLCEQKNSLEEKIAGLEYELLALNKNADELKAQIQEASILNQNLENNITTLSEERQQLLQEIETNREVLTNLEQEILDLKSENVELNNKTVELTAKLDETVIESNERALEIEKLNAAKATLDEQYADLEAAFKTHRDTSEEKIKELTSIIEAKDKEIDSKASTVNQLMSQLKISTDVRSKLELNLQKLREEMEIERDAAKEKENKMSGTIGQLETSVRNKDNELSKQMSIILEMRSEKERLQEKIQSMQNTIDNIQKELTRPPPSTPNANHIQPELDDNAVMLTPSHKRAQLMPRSPTLPKPDTQFLVPRPQGHEPKLDSMLYNLFSDSSMEGDTLDSAEVNRRFEALSRGESLSPAPLSALKRRGVPIKISQENDAQISLSQVKNTLKSKQRVFFKNKRPENKQKRMK